RHRRAAPRRWPVEDARAPAGRGRLGEHTVDRRSAAGRAEPAPAADAQLEVVREARAPVGTTARAQLPARGLPVGPPAGPRRRAAVPDLGESVPLERRADRGRAPLEA